MVAALSCPLQSRCPGCPLGDREYEAGLAVKERELRAALSGYCDLSPELQPPRGAATAHAYRLRAKLVSRGRALGLFERGSHRVVDVSGCRVLTPELTRATDAVRRLLPLPLYGVDLRQASEGVLVTLIAEHAGDLASLQRAAQGLVERGDAASVAVAARRAGDVRLLSGEPQVVAGPSQMRHALEPNAPYGYAAHGGFVQAHAGQASYVYAAIARGLAGRTRVLELFAGNGSLALALAKGGAEVTAVEAFAPAIALAERAAREQQLSLEAVAMDATRFASQLAPSSFDAIVVNPPRRGLEPALRQALGRLAPRALAYVSCNPHTLARDAWHLQTLGSRLAQAEPLDMIPWSDAVEVLAWFFPQDPAPPRVLFESDRYLAIDKLPHDAPHDGLRRVQGLPQWSDAVALDGWGAGVSGVCWFAKDAALSRSAAPGERELGALCRGNLRKQGTISRPDAPGSGARYNKRAELGRHSFTSVRTRDRDERGILADFARIRHAVLGDATLGDAPSNDFMQHRHGLDRPFVHVLRSGLRLSSGENFEAQSELAPDLARVLHSMESERHY